MKQTSDDAYRNELGLIVMCMRCRRTMRSTPEGNRWEFVAKFVEKRPGKVKDGLCEECLERYYPKV